MPSTWLAFDRIRAYARANRLYQHERIFQDQSQLDRITAGSEFLDWSQQASVLDQTNLQINRLTRYRDYEQMDQTGCVSLALDLYADESSLIDPERKHTLIIRARSRRLKKELEELFFQTLQWDSQCRACIRYVSKFGDCPYEIVPTRNRDGVGSIRHMNVYNFTRIETRYGDLVGFFFQDDLIQEPIFLHPWQVMHLRLTSLENMYSPYGRSILDGGRKAYKQLRLMEDAALIYRITRAPEKRKFKIPVGMIPVKEVPEYMEAIARKFKRQRFYNVATGTFDERYSPLIQEDDFFLPQRCLPQYTEIALLDGSVATLGQLRQRYGNAGRFWVYSYDLVTRRFIPKLARCVVGPRSAKIIRITLDDGTTIDSTLDHKHFLSNGTVIQVESLRVGDSLLSLYRRSKKLRSGKNVGEYEQVLDPFSGDWEFTHRLVVRDCPTGYVRHHKDFDRLNNEPVNLELMTVTGHKDLHAKHGREIMRRLHADPTMKAKFAIGTERGIGRYNTSERAQIEHQTIRAPHVRKKWHNGDYDHTVGRNHVEYVDLDAYKEILRRLLVENGGFVKRAVSAWNDDTTLRAAWKANKATVVAKIAEWGYESVVEFCGLVPQTLKEKMRPYAAWWLEVVGRLGVVGAVREWNSDTDKQHLWRASHACVARLARAFGWQPTNHKVIAIEILPDQQDTYCLEVEDTHNFLLANGVLTHNSDGTGPDIETLPGAENLDAIADIEYFKKNMIAPMKIPFSRVGIGESAGEASEKSLSAVHPEFAKSVQWIQREVAAGLTKVAIVHLALRGYSVEDLRGFELSLPSTSAIEELYRITTWQTRVQVMTELKELAWFPKEWIVTHFTDLTPDEILELKEMEEMAGDDGEEDGVGGGAGGGGLGGGGLGGDAGGLGGDAGGLGGDDAGLGGDAGGLGGDAGGGLGGDDAGGLGGAEPPPDDALGERFDVAAEKRVLTELRRRDRHRHTMELVKKWAGRRGFDEARTTEVVNHFQFLLETKELDGMSAGVSADVPADNRMLSENKHGFTAPTYSDDDPQLLVEWSVPVGERERAIADTLTVLVGDVVDVIDDSEITTDDLP